MTRNITCPHLHQTPQLTGPDLRTHICKNKKKGLHQHTVAGQVPNHDYSYTACPPTDVIKKYSDHDTFHTQLWEHALSQRAPRCVNEWSSDESASLLLHQPCGIFLCFPLFGAVQQHSYVALTPVCFWSVPTPSERGRAHSTWLIASPPLAKHSLSVCLSVWGADKLTRRALVSW